MKYRAILVSLFVVAFLIPSKLNAQAQGNIYAYEDDSKYYTIELDTKEFPTWGVYRSINHHSIPYFEMTFLADMATDKDGGTLLKIVPTYYTYSYRAKIIGQADTVNLKKQKLKFHFRMKNNGKELEYVVPDSITRKQMIDFSSFDSKDVIDITSMPTDYKLVKSPKWNKFPLELRNELGARFRKGLKGPVLK